MIRTTLTAKSAQKQKGKRFIWVFIVLGICNYGIDFKFKCPLSGYNSSRSNKSPKEPYCVAKAKKKTPKTFLIKKTDKKKSGRNMYFEVGKYTLYSKQDRVMSIWPVQ